MRRAVTPAIPASMYRHFAIVTVLLTTGLAMFADGENKQAQAAQLAQRAPARPAAPAAFATASPTPASRQPVGSWGSDEVDSSFGMPTGGTFGGASGVIPDTDDLVAPGYSPEYLASLSEEERQMLLQGLQDNGMLDAEIQGRRSAEIRAASRRRSGAASRGD